MYAIVEIAGKQYRVEKDKQIKVPLLKEESGKKVTFDRVLFMSDDSGNNQIGSPVLDGVQVAATVVEHGRDKKIIVFKKKRRKGYQVKNGHRQQFSLIKIDSIGKSTAAKKAKAADEKPKKETAAKTVKEEAKKPAAKKTAEAKPKTAAKPKTVAKPKAASAAKKTTKTAKPKDTTAAKPKAEPKAKATKTKAKPAEEKEA